MRTLEDKKDQMMKKLNLLETVARPVAVMSECLLVIGLVCLPSVPVQAETTNTWAFDKTAIGSLPKDWKVESMGKTNPLISISIAGDATAPSALANNQVLKVTSFDPAAAYADCHICWTPTVAFEDGTIEVDSKCSGDTNGYGGGIAWRIKDKNNYYAVRYSVKEGNVNVFKIADGVRKSVGAGGKGEFAIDKWYHVKVIQNGSNITVSVDGKEIATATDTSIAGAGGVGVFQRGNASIGVWDNFFVTTGAIP